MCAGLQIPFQKEQMEPLRTTAFPYFLLTLSCNIINNVSHLPIHVCVCKIVSYGCEMRTADIYYSIQLQRDVISALEHAMLPSKIITY